MTDKTTAFSIFNDTFPDDAKCGRIIQQDLCLYIKWDEPSQPSETDEYSSIDECAENTKNRTEAEIFSDLFIKLNVFLKRKRVESSFKLSFMGHNQLCVVPNNSNSSNKHVDFLFTLLQTKFAVKNQLTHKVYAKEKDCQAAKQTTTAAPTAASPPPVPPPLGKEKQNLHEPVIDDDDDGDDGDGEESVSSHETDGSHSSRATTDNEIDDAYNYGAETARKAEPQKHCSNVKSEWDKQSLADSFSHTFGNMMQDDLVERKFYEKNILPHTAYTESLAPSFINNIGDLGI